MNGQDKRGERAALYAAMGAGMGTGVGAAFAISVGPLAIAVCAVLGAVGGMGVGFYRGKHEE